MNEINSPSLGKHTQPLSLSLNLFGFPNLLFMHFVAFVDFSLLSFLVFHHNHLCLPLCHLSLSVLIVYGEIRMPFVQVNSAKSWQRRPLMRNFTPDFSNIYDMISCHLPSSAKMHQITLNASRCVAGFGHCCAEFVLSR